MQLHVLQDKLQMLEEERDEERNSKSLEIKELKEKAIRQHLEMEVLSSFAYNVTRMPFFFLPNRSIGIVTERGDAVQALRSGPGEPTPGTESRDREGGGSFFHERGGIRGDSQASEAKDRVYRSKGEGVQATTRAGCASGH